PAVEDPPPLAALSFGRRRVVAGRVRGEPLLLVGSLRTDALGSADSHAQRLGDFPEDGGRRSTHQDDVLTRGHLEHDRLDVSHVPTLGLCEALPDGWLLLRSVVQLQVAFAEALRVLRDDLAVCEL